MCVLDRHAAGGDEKGRTLLSCPTAANFQMRSARDINLQEILGCLVREAYKKLDICRVGNLLVTA